MPEPAQPAESPEARAREAILEDIRDRRLLKWLFAEDADTNPVAIGYVDGPLDEATQRECVDTWVSLAIAASTARPTEREPVAWCSPGQLANLTDVDRDGGVYLPIRKTERGNFTMPLYAARPTERGAVEECDNEEGPPEIWGDPPTSPARIRLEALARRPDNWRHIYDKAVSPDALDDLARDLREVLGSVNLLAGENNMTRELEIKADEILRKHGSDMLWPRGPGRDTWAAAIHAIAEALGTPAPNTFTLAQVKEMWRTGVETGGILAKKDGE